MENERELGIRLREARKSRGLSQAKLAQLLGLEQQTVSRIETGKQTGGAPYVMSDRTRERVEHWIAEPIAFEPITGRAALSMGPPPLEHAQLGELEALRRLVRTQDEVAELKEQVSELRETVEQLRVPQHDEVKTVSVARIQKTTKVPYVADLAAGPPIQADEISDTLDGVPAELIEGDRPDDARYVVKARGTSMEKAGIKDGTFVLVRNVRDSLNYKRGQIVVAEIQGPAGPEGTIKRYLGAGKGLRCFLSESDDPADELEPIPTSESKIVGVVLAYRNGQDEWVSVD